MSLIEKGLFRITNGKRTINSPIFLKEFDSDNNQLNDLIELSNKVKSNKREYIDKDIRLLKQGLDGEKNVYYELKNSFIPMLCLHDIRLEYDGYVAQFDFIIITKKCIFVLETKTLNGDIEITHDGDFVRIIRNRYGKFIKKEGMYSPISQNERHVNILRNILIKEKLITTFDIKSIVVMANPKSIINKTNCPKDIKENIYKYDQVNSLIKKDLDDEKNSKDLLEKYLYAMGNYLRDNDKPITFNYMSKYSLTEEDFKDDTLEKNNNNKETITLLTSKENKQYIECKDIIETKTIEKLEEKIVENLEVKTNEKSSIPNKTGDDDYEKIYKLLKEYRNKTSTQECLKAYMVFNNEELTSLIESKPRNKEELLKVRGFGLKKVEKYGESILEIINS